jgi:LmbE family N-acetylglucosaminyl deacetylase
MPHFTIIVAADADTDATADFVKRQTQRASSCASLVVQTSQTWQALVCCPGQNIGAAELPDARFREVQTDPQHRSLPAQFNAALATGLATGDWVLFLRAGDVLLPDALQVFSQAVVDTPGAQVICACACWHVADGSGALGGGVTQEAVERLMAFRSGKTTQPPLIAAVIHKNTWRALNNDPNTNPAFDTTLRFAWNEAHLLKLRENDAPTSTVALRRETVVCLPKPPEDVPVGYEIQALEETLMALDRAELPAPTRQRLNDDVTLRTARLCLQRNERMLAQQCYRRAVANAQFVDTLLRDSMDVIPDEAAAFVADVVATAPAQIKHAALARVHEASAFHTHKPSEIVRHAARAFALADGPRANRGLWKRAVRSALGQQPDGSTSQPVDTRSGDVLLAQATQSGCVFLSPHYDDAALSCGGLLTRLSQRSAQVTMLTVFTADAANPDDTSPLAHTLRALWHTGHGQDEVYKVRAEEERGVCEALGFGSAWLGFPEAPCRYPRMRTVDELVSPGYDLRQDVAYAALRERLGAELDAHRGACVFVPLGVGHLDHLLVYAVVDDLITAGEVNHPVMYYEDYPYAARSGIAQRLAQVQSHTTMWPHTLALGDALRARFDLIQRYHSQMRMLFETESGAFDELNTYAMSVGGGAVPCERYWTSRASK